MRVLIVDDEIAARQRLAALLAELDVEVVGEASDGVSALERIRALAPDVVLLDIAMPEVDGFDVARHVQDPKPLIIFQTAYSEHALRAFEHEPVDYVVKPVGLTRLQQAIERARRRLAGGSRPQVTSEVLSKIEAAFGQPRPQRRTRVLVRAGAAHRVVLVREISRFIAEDGLVSAITASGQHLTDYTLNDLETRLAGLFVRANRAELIQIDRVDRVASNGDGSAAITLTDGTRVHVSRRRAADVRDALR